MHFKVITLFPEMYSSFLAQGIVKRAIDEGLIQVELINFRQSGLGRHKHVDDTPYGGGAGMLLRPEPVISAIEESEKNSPLGYSHKVLFTPQGKPYTQQRARELSQLEVPITLICGRYEGFDERIRYFVNEEISLGDYILLGGEIGALVLIESISRLIPGVIGNQDSLNQESFGQGLLEYAQYTRPPDYRGYQVPEILLSGNHQEIKSWRKKNSLERTKRKRPELLKNNV